MDAIIEKRQNVANLVSNAREIVDRAEKEKRSMAADEVEQYDKIMDTIDETKKQIDRMEKIANLNNELDQPLNEPTRINPEGGQGKAQNKRATDEYQNSFNKFLRSGLNSLNSSEIQNMQSTDDADGGFLVAPEQFVSELIQQVDDNVFIRQWARKFSLESAESLGVPSLDQDFGDADWVSELRTGQKDDLKFGKRELHPHPLAKRVLASNKLIRISKIGIDNLIRERLGYKFGVTMEKAYLTGDGANKPLGVFTASNDGISTSRDVATGNTTTEITFDGLIESKYSLKDQYQRNAKWMFHRDALKQIAKIKDSNGQYIWRPNVVAGEPDSILDIPYYMSEFVPNTFSTGNYVGILGDFSKYWIADALNMQVQRLVELYAETNQVGYIGRLESDGMPVLEEAFARITLA
ncbi:phage major capsid protein [Terrihalobacillus insolitus]|uniref:phage major capsid protein n=1 Tax=Terrihalobacillus insolitus TaxID=2950438 RepID=UPI0023404CAB|nr:phage major capsid protein [Terrihalobacillus insolitus]MDC3414273.1 phage major capsid protein [Terrihalobacillus insolitus]